jgi:drug/metabolite transporter (DMT)-like permease
MLFAFRYLGLTNGVVLLPLLFILISVAAVDLSNLTWTIFAALVAKGLCDNVVSDYLWARACLLTSPTVATVGLTLTVPLAFISDMLIKHESITGLKGSGAVLVLMGFFLVNEIVRFRNLCSATASNCDSLEDSQTHSQVGNSASHTISEISNQ